nr:integrase, catalytic region, zinc finger, CCHC-type, peptidase aspartic, catalytic [Tanacetum cinerariifolium]
MFMANLSSADPVTDEAGPSYDLDILSEVQDHDQYQDVVCTHHEEHAMHDSVQLDHVVESHADYTNDNNMIPYDQYVNDNETANSQITKLTEQVTNLQAQDNLFRAENDKIKQHYKELYDSIKITRAKHIEQVTALTTKNVNMKDQTLEKVNSVRVNSCPNASGSQPKSNIKTNRISPAKGVNKLPVEDQPRINKSHLRTSNRVDSSSRLKRTISVETHRKSPNHHWPPIEAHELDIQLKEPVPLTRFTPPKVVSDKQNKKWASCLKHMTGDRSRLMNFVKKFIRTVRFENDHFGAIMGYEDYVISDSVISRVYYVEVLGHNLFSVE